MDYIGEHLWPGRLGHFFIILSLISSFVACLSYFLSTVSHNMDHKGSWKRIARMAFITEILSVLIIVSLLLFVLFNHYFEYKYAWQHSSLSLENKFLFASLWEGQEGSFLLWSFWHCILGIIIITRKDKWEAPVMTIISFAQFCLATMTCGFILFGQELGSNPFELLRNEMQAPLFSKPDYLSFIRDGNDLNPILQNYWMVIHPPVLFLGFALFIVPFAYAVAALWTKQYTAWIGPALKWSLVALAILGLGIIMGARWAYESLSFGGYWVWDPVENASLVPWLILVSGIHTLVISRKTGQSLRASFIFIQLSYVFILYSTFLTRSGILGDTSVHSFTGSGMNVQLLAFLFSFIITSVILTAKRYKHIPVPLKDEKISSREFWMFSGSLILFLSALSIICMTSIPVFNQLASIFSGSKDLFSPIALGEDVEYSYNKIQVWVAILIGLLTATVQYLKYKQTPAAYVRKKLMMPFVVSVLLGALVMIIGNFDYDKHGKYFMVLIHVAVFSSIYAIMANLVFIFNSFRGQLKMTGSAISHTGFAIMLLGILVSASKKQVVSVQDDPTSQGTAEARENLTLIKNIPIAMGPYKVTYLEDSMHPEKSQVYYKIKFEEQKHNRSFELAPNAFVNYKGNVGLMSNPDARHYWDHDLFVYISSIPDPSKNRDTVIQRQFEIKKGNEVDYERGSVLLDDIRMSTGLTKAGLQVTDTVWVATLAIQSKRINARGILKPILIRRQGQSYSFPDTLHETNQVMELKNVTNVKVSVNLAQVIQPLSFVTIKVYRFPLIVLIWTGAILLFAGLIISAIISGRFHSKKHFTKKRAETASLHVKDPVG